MGLYAFVYCDCVEKGRLRIPHPFPKLLYIEENGSPEIKSKDPKKIAAHDGWMEGEPCEHAGMLVGGGRLGNAAFIAFLADLVARVSRSSRHSFPILSGRVISSGTHTGDWLTLPEVRRLETELKRVSRVKFEKMGIRSNQAIEVRKFIAKLAEVTEGSIKVGKPIAL